MPTEAHGNLWVQPGSHVRERAAREARTLDEGALHSRPTPPYTHAGAHAIRIQWPGSVILFDKDLVHAGGPNLSADIRYALYYRLRFEAPPREEGDAAVGGATAAAASEAGG